MPACLGLDTSNYTTSAAVFDGAAMRPAGQLLSVPEGAMGLRQSDALFQHVKRLPELFSRLGELGAFTDLRAVGASTQPRRLEGSYMPCFLPGETVGRCLAQVLGVSFFSFSHQEGHIAAAAWSAGREDLLDRPHLAWHLSGGTTELLYVQPEGREIRARRVGGTSDISAGQLLDRTGRLLGLPFPAGAALDRLTAGQGRGEFFPVKIKDYTFSLSGVENKVKALAERGEAPQRVACYALDTIANAVLAVTRAVQAGGEALPVLCSGGVASSQRLRHWLEGAVFAQPAYSSDNAAGVALLAYRQIS
ncbi:MAG: DNA-binding protein [Oscillospiraceae bacterium]|nr:DNA-binding protein [Oscillospiraceae bacterium]